jgi:hypothetical protein
LESHAKSNLNVTNGLYVVEHGNSNQERAAGAPNDLKLSDDSGVAQPVRKQRM